MSLPLNPMGLNGPGWVPNYVQPNTGNPAAQPGVANYPVGANSMDLTYPRPAYVQPDYPTYSTSSPAFPLGS